MKLEKLEDMMGNCPYCEGSTECQKEVCAKYNAWIDTQNPIIKVNTIKELIGIDVNNDGTNQLDIMMKMQHKLQSILAERTGKPIDCFTPEEINERMLMMERAISDELAEVRAHLNWKDWKKADWSRFEDLTELKKEVIDIWHFIMNMFIILGMDSDEVYNAYINKNVENVLRQKYNY